MALHRLRWLRNDLRRHLAQRGWSLAPGVTLPLAAAPPTAPAMLQPALATFSRELLSATGMLLEDEGKASSPSASAQSEAATSAASLEWDTFREQTSKFASAVGRELFVPISRAASQSLAHDSRKVTVVGVGNVGIACAQTILTEDIADEIALVDVNKDKLRGEMLDLQHGAAFLPRSKIVASTDYAVTAGSDLCVVTAGARQKEGESRLSLVGRNVDILKHIIPQLVKYSPNTILLLVSNPVDILSWAAWKISGLPTNRVIGTGTNLDSSRFRSLLASSLHVSPRSVQAFIIGEHGDSSVPLWSSASIGGIPLMDFISENKLNIEKATLDSLHKQVVDSAYEVIRLKGYTSWAIGYSVASLARNIFRDQRTIQPLSVLVQGHHGIEEEVFTSLPVLLGRDGLLSIAKGPLSSSEKKSLETSAKLLWSIQKDLGIV